LVGLKDLLQHDALDPTADLLIIMFTKFTSVAERIWKEIMGETRFWHKSKYYQISLIYDKQCIFCLQQLVEFLSGVRVGPKKENYKTYTISS
jgi:hypothetical protein